MKLAILTLSVLALLFTFSTETFAVNFTVTRGDDRNGPTCQAGDCSLREAANAASASPTDDTISFAGVTVINLFFEISIGDYGTLSINGPGANILTINGEGAPFGTNRIFYSGYANVTIQRLTLSNGNGNGAAVFADGGTVKLESVVVRNNRAISDRAAIFFQGGTNHRIANSTISNNTGSSCVAIRANGGTLTVENTTVSGNSTVGDGYAGAICVFGPVATATFRNTTISGNTSSGTGLGGGAGIYIDGFAATANLVNTIVAGNTDARAPDLYRNGTSPAFVTSGGNLIGDNTGNPAAPNTGTFPAGNPNANGDKVGIAGSPIDPLLGPLQNNGGTTQTRELLMESPANNSGINSAAPATDQRGVARPQNGTVDIGAFEAGIPTWTGQTNTGTNVNVVMGTVSVTFSSVLTAGTTTVVPIAPGTAGPLPAGYSYGSSFPAYEITTTAVYTPPITVCLQVPGVTNAATFAALRILHYVNGVATDRTILPPDTPAPDFATKTICARVNSLSPFVVAERLAPSAASVSVAGRVLDVNGRGIPKVRVTIQDAATGESRTVLTNPFGYYSFAEVLVGEVYILSAEHKRYQFSPRVITVRDEIADADLNANP